MFGYNLIHAGTLALARAEQVGLRIDVDYCNKTIDRLAKRVGVLENDVFKSEIGQLWYKEFGRRNTNYNSDDQFRTILFDKLGYEPERYTDRGQPSVDEDALNKVDVEGVDELVKIRKLSKAKDTYLTNFIREQVGGVLHPFFNLHTVSTYRSSSNSINFQNIPNRDNDIRKLVRNAVYPRYKHKLASIDFSGAEVRIGCAYHNDPNMRKYILDPTTDMHRDTVMDLYKITPKEWETLKSQETDDLKMCKPIRNEGKTFVFAEFYGDWYKAQAPRLWKVSDKLKFLDHTTIRQHLKNHGLNTYEAFENHIKLAEEIMWQQRFKKYNKWRSDFWDDYCKKGWFKTKTGFVCQGEMTRNEVTNSPIQGSAFHCLLLAFIILDHIAIEQKWDSKLVAQIHDEVLIDIHPAEEDHVLETVRWCMTEAVPQIYKFINIPLEVEADITPVDGSWYTKKGYEFKN